MPEMFLDRCYSEIGRSSVQQLNALRRQLGVGCDPCFDYSEVTEMQKSLGKKEKDKKTKPSDDASAGPASGLEQLRRALREVVGAGGGLDDLQDKDGAEGASPVGVTGAPTSPADARRLREESRNTSAFKAPGRHQLQQLDLENRFRAPPVGSYKPKDHLLNTRPKVLGMDFGLKPATRSRHVLKVQEEVERLQAEGMSTDHLVKSASSIDLMETIPEKLRTRPKESLDIGKSLPRPDMVKQANITFHTNSFTAGVLDGDKMQSGHTRGPEWDFAKSSTAKEKLREYYFQPGQYKPNLDAARETVGNKKNIGFEMQSDRPPLNKGSERAGDHLPDRSLSRSCPCLARYEKCVHPPKQILSISKQTLRPPIITTKDDYHDVTDPAVDQAVMQKRLTYDAFAATAPTWSRPKTVEKFDISLQRKQQLKIQRAYGTDVALAMSKENLTRGPVSVELLDNYEIDKKPQLVPRVKVKNFVHMPGRDIEHKYIKAPSRKATEKMHSASKFERNGREGDARPEAYLFSDITSGIKSLRAQRSYTEE